ncbi:MAG: glutaminyl-peptide cyclotransferase, partial [Candidatus Adiutrix sp.]|nr:glutaminyl-peptide cyclotransferase [Candidatus Adiutrix sp.]
MPLKNLSVALMAAVLALGPGQAGAAAPALAPALLNSRLHPDPAYTQGLFFDGDNLYISAGLYGRSEFACWSFGALPASAPQQAFRPPGHFFAEGAALAEGEIYLLTWRNETVFVLNPDNLTPARRLPYDGEGWGLGWDGARLWRSDGSAFLRPHRPGDFAPAGPALRVHDDGREVSGLNELEWDPATGLMLANVYESDLVAAIDLSDGRV